jgi:hypothetical protein
MPDNLKPVCGFCGRVIDGPTAKYDAGSNVYLHDGPSANHLRISMGNGFSHAKVERLEIDGQINQCAVRYLDRKAMGGESVYLTTVELTDLEPEALVGSI